MIKILLKSKLTKSLNKKEILSICKLKNTYWKYGIKSQLNWFIKHIKKNDIHNLAYLKNNLVGYIILRNRSFFYKKKKKNYFYFDSLIVKKKNRELKVGQRLIYLTSKIIKKSKLHSMLICEKKNILFYEKYGWKIITKDKSKILDHKYSKFSLMMCFNQKPEIMKSNIKYFTST
jgi:N-acetylglutamate synthase-like GNAT family acetyltransferase